MKVLVTGYSGQLGFDVIKELEKRKIECRGVSSKDFNLKDNHQMESYVRDYAPDCIIHCAAYTKVDMAEDESLECYKVNTLATINLAIISNKIGAKFLMISSDYVFDGEGTHPYTVDEQYNPLNVYGISKALAEQGVRDNCEKYFIVRISWVFGDNGNNFVKTMLRLGSQRAEISVVSDQIGSPTYTKDAAVLICDFVSTEKYGIYHVTNEGFCSWAEFAEQIFKVANYKTKINPIKTEEFPTKAIRPKNSKMNKNKLTELGFRLLPPWEDAVTRYIGDMK